MLPLYRRLLLLYPQKYRDEFGREMMAVLRDAQGAIRSDGFATGTWFCLREITGLLRGALREHFCSLAGCHPTDSYLLRRFHMRSEFRFPRSTAALMAVVLAVVLLTIEKAKGIQLTYSASRSDVMIMWSVLPSAVAQVFLLVALAAVIGWLIMFALGRSGVHRLSRLSSRLD